jgi:hypothetical protein
VELIFDDLPDGYSITAADRRLIIRLCEEMLTESLEGSLEISEVTYAGNRRSLVASHESQPSRRRLESVSLPLTITAVGPKDESGTALAQIMEAIEKNKYALLAEIASEIDAFKGASLTTDTFDPSAPITPKPTKRPTPPPTPDVKQTTHTVQLTLSDVPVGFRLSADDKAFILREVQNVIEDNIDDQFELIKVAYGSTSAKPGMSGNRGGSSGSNTDGSPTSLLSIHKNHDRSLLSPRKLASMPLTMDITIEGPTDLSDVALSYLMDALKENIDEVERKLKSLDWNRFKSVNVLVGSYDPASSSFKRKETEHPVELNFDNVSNGYRFSAGDRAALIRFVKDLLDDNLHDSLELIGVADAQMRNSRGLLVAPPSHTRRLKSLSVPLLVTVKGPEESADIALSYVMDVIQDHEEELRQFLKSLDWDAFKDVSISAEAFDRDSLPSGPVEMEETVHPVQLVMEDVAPGYRLNTADRASIIRFTKELLDDNIDALFQVIGVEYAGNDYGKDKKSANNNNMDSFRAGGNDDPSKSNLSTHHSKKGNKRKLTSARRLDTLALPLRISLKGPADESDYALSYIMDVIRNKQGEIEDFLNSLGSAFKTVSLTPVSYDDFESMAKSTPGIAETRHPFEMTIDRVPADYQLSADDRASVVGHVRKLLVDSLAGSLDLIDIAESGSGLGRGLLTSSTRGRTKELSLPLTVTVKGPEDNSDDAPYRILQALQDKTADVESYLRTLDSETFSNSKVSFKSIGSPNMKNDGGDAPWWVTSWWIWMIVGIGLFFLLCCLCVCCGFMSRYKQRKEKDSAKEGPIVVEKPVFVEKPLIVDRPVLHPPPRPPNAMVPYYHQGHNAMVPYQQRLPPPPVHNSNSMVPYHNHPGLADRRMLAIEPPPPQDAFSIESSYISSQMSSRMSSVVESIEDTHWDEISLSTASVLPSAREPPGETIEQKKQEQKKMLLLAAHASAQYAPVREPSKHLQITAGPSQPKRSMKKITSGQEQRKHFQMEGREPSKPLQIEGQKSSKPLQIEASPTHAHETERRMIAARDPSVGDAHKQIGDAPARRMSQELVPYEPPDQGQLELYDGESYATRPPGNQPPGHMFDEESYATQPPGHEWSLYSEEEESHGTGHFS